MEHSRVQLAVLEQSAAHLAQAESRPVLSYKLGDMPSLVEGLRNAIDSDDDPALRPVAHTLSSSRAALRALALCQLDRALITRARTGCAQSTMPTLAWTRAADRRIETAWVSYVSGTVS
jgi:hypothetical protein